MIDEIAHRKIGDTIPAEDFVGNSGNVTGWAFYSLTNSRVRANIQGYWLEYWLAATAAMLPQDGDPSWRFTCRSRPGLRCEASRTVLGGFALTDGVTNANFYKNYFLRDEWALQNG